MKKENGGTEHGCPDGNKNRGSAIWEGQGRHRVVDLFQARAPDCWAPDELGTWATISCILLTFAKRDSHAVVQNAQKHHPCMSPLIGEGAL